MKFQEQVTNFSVRLSVTTQFRCSSIFNLPCWRLCNTVFMVFSVSFRFLLVTLECMEGGLRGVGMCAGAGASANAGACS